MACPVDRRYGGTGLWGSAPTGQVTGSLVDASLYIAFLSDSVLPVRHLRVYPVKLSSLAQRNELPGLDSISSLSPLKPSFNYTEDRLDYVVQPDRSRVGRAGGGGAC